MGFTTIPGSLYTWDSALFSWDDPDSVKTWDDAYPAVFIGEFDEPVNFAEAISKSPSIPLPEIFPSFADAIANGPNKQSDEPLNFAEVYSRIAEFEPFFAESFALAEAMRQAFGKNVDEPVSLVEAILFQYGMNTAEAWTIADLFDRAIDWERSYAENFLFADAYFRQIGLNKSETFQVYDTLVRQGPIVISDLVVRSDEVTFASFVLTVSNNVPSGYGPFQPFVIGDYDLTRALIKITMTRENEQQDLRLLKGKVFADVPDVRDTGEVNIPVAGTATIVFARKFLAPPKITIGILGVAGGGSHRHFNVTKTGFQLELLDSSGAVTTGYATWHAEGY